MIPETRSWSDPAIPCRRCEGAKSRRAAAATRHSSKLPAQRLHRLDRPGAHCENPNQTRCPNVDELQRGGIYMKMPHPASARKAWRLFAGQATTAATSWRGAASAIPSKLQRFSAV